MNNHTLVDTRIGTRGDGNTLPGAFTPWGMASVCPHTERTYGQYADDMTIHGFGHAHLSGVGGSCLGGVIVAAAGGGVPPARSEYASPAAQERPGVGAYRVRLARWDIEVASTVTPRTGLTRFVLPGGDASLFLDLAHGHSPRKGGFIRRVDDRAVEGWKNDGHFCGTEKPHRLYFAARLIAPTRPALELWSGGAPVCGEELDAADAAVVWRLRARAGEAVELRVGLSYVSAANAWLNLDTEQAGRDFAAIEQAAVAAWDDVLDRIVVEGGSDEQRTMLYTALYHACLHPNLHQDVNGEYPATGSFATRSVRGRERYTVFSLWDTYRTVVPLYALLFPERLAAMTATMVDMAAEQGFLPKWELCGNETYIMPGDPALPAIADAWVRGVRGFDIEAAYAAMVRNADAHDTRGHSDIRPGLGAYLQYGYLPHDLAYARGPVWTTAMKGSVSFALESYTADAALASLAEALGRRADAVRYARRAAGWRNLFDPATGFIRPRNADGAWVEPFDPAQVGGGAWDKRSAPGFVEGNAWQYTFAVPHDMPALVRAMGGPAAFAARLQDCFDGGHYDGTNEPDMAYPFLFNYAAGEEWRTQKTVRDCITRYWSTRREGIPGNDDCGTLSAWLIFAMLGFYPDCPARPSYQLCAPVFDRIEIRPAGAEARFQIETCSASPADWRIAAMELDGRPWSGYELPHARLAGGGTLRMRMARQG